MLVLHLRCDGCMLAVPATLFLLPDICLFQFMSCLIVFLCKELGNLLCVLLTHSLLGLPVFTTLLPQFLLLRKLLFQFVSSLVILL